jgi:hypothetical protein
MKASDADILIIPGYTNSGPGHWQSRWEAKLSTARRVEQAEWTKPVREDWIARIAEEVNAFRCPHLRRDALGDEHRRDQSDPTLSSKVPLNLCSSA